MLAVYVTVEYDPGQCSVEDERWVYYGCYIGPVGSERPWKCYSKPTDLRMISSTALSIYLALA